MHLQPHRTTCIYRHETGMKLWFLLVVLRHQRECTIPPGALHCVRDRNTHWSHQELIERTQEMGDQNRHTTHTRSSLRVVVHIQSQQKWPARHLFRGVKPCYWFRTGLWHHSRIINGSLECVCVCNTILQIIVFIKQRQCIPCYQLWRTIHNIMVYWWPLSHIDVDE